MTATRSVCRLTTLLLQHEPISSENLAQRQQLIEKENKA